MTLRRGIHPGWFPASRLLTHSPDGERSGRRSQCMARGCRSHHQRLAVTRFRGGLHPLHTIGAETGLAMAHRRSPCLPRAWSRCRWHLHRGPLDAHDPLSGGRHPRFCRPSGRVPRHRARAPPRPSVAQVGIALLVASLLTLVLVGTMIWVFTPGTRLSSLRLGGLMERVVFVEVEIWYLALGWRIFFHPDFLPGQREPHRQPVCS